MSDQDKQSRDNWILQFPALCLASVYFLGFLVVGRHLARYGVSTFSLLQAQYLVAGMWAIVPLIAITLVFRTTDTFRNKAYSYPGVSWQRYLAVTAMVLILFGLWVLITVGLLGEFSFSLVAHLNLFAILLMVPVDLAWVSWQVPARPETWWRNRNVLPFYLTWSAFGLVAYILLFAGSFYPLIPAALGGGEPRTIRFIQADGRLPYGIETGDAFSGTFRTGLSAPYKLLTTTDKSYIVISQVSNEESIEVSQETVEGIIVLKEDAQ